MKNRSRLTYANVVSTAALVLALSGGVALAAGKVHTNGIFKRAVTSGKLAIGAVRSNQIANGAVGARQIADGTVGSRQIGAAAVAPSNLQFPVFFVASPIGGSAPVPSSESVPYPLADANWAQNPGQLNVVFGAAVATLAYNGDGEGFCQVYFEISVNGRQVGGGALQTSSTSQERVEASLGAQPEVDPPAPRTNNMTVRLSSNGGCTGGSTVDSARFRALDFG